MEGHTAAAYLRVYQPLAAFPARERTQWAAYVEAGRLPPATVLVGREERRGFARALGLAIKDVASIKVTALEDAELVLVDAA